MPPAAGDLSPQRVFEISAVEDLGQAVDRRQPVHLVVVHRLDVVAGDEFEDGSADFDEVAVAELAAALDVLIVDEGAVGRPVVFDADPLALNF